MSKKHLDKYRIVCYKNRTESLLLPEAEVQSVVTAYVEVCS